MSKANPTHAVHWLHARNLLLTAAMVAALTGCTDEPEVLPPVGNHQLYIDTDALVPPALGSGVTSEVPSLFDRLEVAVLADDGEVACSGCAREFDVDVSTFADGGASLAIVPAPGTAPLARVRLFRAEARLDGVLQPEAVIEVVVQLPVTPEEGTVETTVFLPTEAVGVPRGRLEAPLQLGTSPLVTAGAPTSSQVGTWAFANRTGCADASPEGAACIEGGPYWMGNPLVRGADFAESDRQRLVVLSPFFLDEGEVTVAQFRAWAASQAGPVEVLEHVDDPASEAFFCTFTAEPTASDARPVNCVGYEAAAAFCEAQGGTLPTEAQFEYASGDLRSALFVWGQDELALCEGAVWGRGGRDGTSLENVGVDACLPIETALDGPVALSADPGRLAQTRLTDRLTTGTGEVVFDLAGNLQEWALDYYHRQDESCWVGTESNVWFDPVCHEPGEAGSFAVRGGAWTQDRAFLRAAYRSTRTSLQDAPYQVGFRCAYPAPPAE